MKKITNLFYLFKSNRHLEKALKFYEEKKKVVKVVSIILIILIALTTFFVKGEIEKKHKMEKAYVSVERQIKKEKKSDVEKPKEEIKITVDISGAVKNPGVYEVNKDTRVNEVIEKAGGLDENANVDTVNRATFVKDGQKIYIPYTNKFNSLSSERTESAGENPININRASEGELKTIAGIGDHTAKLIVDYRRENGDFTSVDDLTKIKGIGKKLVEKIRNKVTV